MTHVMTPDEWRRRLEIWDVRLQHRDRSINTSVPSDQHHICDVAKKVWTLSIAPLTSQTRDQQRFTISEVAADWDEHYVAIYCPR